MSDKLNVLGRRDMSHNLLPKASMGRRRNTHANTDDQGDPI